MESSKHTEESKAGDQAPGDERTSETPGIKGYMTGLVLSTLLTGASFWAASTSLIYGPGVPYALTALAIAQMGVHLVFFLHLSTAPDNSNNILALAFGVLIILLLLGGSLWIMYHLDLRMMPMQELEKMQR